MDVGDVIGIEPGTNGNAQSAYLKTELINQKLSEITSQIQKNLSRAEIGDVDSLEQLTDVEIEKNQLKKRMESFGMYP